MKNNQKSDITGRRAFIIKLLMLLSGITAIIISIPLIGAFFEPILRKRSGVWRDVGQVKDYKIGATVLVNFPDATAFPWMGEVSKTGSWLRRVSEDKFVAFAVNCTHLGCPLHWLPDADIFLCPCHGGVFYNDGRYAAGPPPKNMLSYPVRVIKGRVEIFASPIPITTF